jgi:transcriptional regulator with XRE-family HTH domain
LLQAARQIAEARLKLTQTALATAAGVTQGRISQIASEVGGWKALKKILASLLEVLHRTTNIFEPLGEDELWMAQTFLPLAVTEDVSEATKQVTFVAKVYGWKTFKAILTATPIKTKSQLLTLLVGLLPPLVQEEFSALVVT